MDQLVFSACGASRLRDKRVHGLEALLSQLKELVNIRKVTELHALLTHLE